MNRLVGFLNGISLPLVVSMLVTIGREAYAEGCINAFLLLMPICLVCGWTNPHMLTAILSLYLVWYTSYFAMGLVRYEPIVVYPLYGGLLVTAFAMDVRGLYDSFRGRYG